MANFVVSKETVTTTFGTTSGATSNDVALSKGQDYTKCVPICTNRATAGGTDWRQNDWVALEMIDDAGTPTVRVHRNATSTVSQLHVEIQVIEYGSNVNVYPGTASLTGTSVSDSIGGTITEANSFVMFSQVMSSGSGSDDFDVSMIQARFASTTNVQFERRQSTNPDWTVYYYVVESDGTDFTTEYVEANFTSSNQGPAGTTIATVTTTKAFVVSTYENSETVDDLRDAICNVAITGTTTLTWYRDHGTTPSASTTIGCWIVKTSGTEFAVQRFALTIAASTTNDQAITEVDTDKSLILQSNHAAGGTWSIDNTTTGPNVEDRRNTLAFTSTTNVRAQQQQAEASSGTGELRFEVIEFELEAAGDVEFESTVGVLVLTGQTADQAITTNQTFESVVGNLSFTGQTADQALTEHVAYESIAGVLGLTGQTADQAITESDFYESAPGILALTGEVADRTVTDHAYYESVASDLLLSGQVADVEISVAGDIAFESVVGVLALTGRTGDVVTTANVDYEVTAGEIVLTGQPADYLEDAPYSATSGALTLTGQPADAVIRHLYESTPGVLALTGQTADVGLEVSLDLEVPPGLLLLTGLSAEIKLPAKPRRATPIGVRRSYPRRVQILGKRYTVRNPMEERDLFKLIEARERAEAEIVIEPHGSHQEARKARYRARATGKRLKRLEMELKGQGSYTWNLDDELLMFLVADPWL